MKKLFTAVTLLMTATAVGMPQQLNADGLVNANENTATKNHSAKTKHGHKILNHKNEDQIPKHTKRKIQNGKKINAYDTKKLHKAKLPEEWIKGYHKETNTTLDLDDGDKQELSEAGAKDATIHWYDKQYKKSKKKKKDA